LGLVVRTWNVYHGNASPPRRRTFLRRMLELVLADGPDVVCLQELPVWALSRLDHWSGMWSAASVARRPLVPRELAGWLTRRHQGLLRSAITGQANAILVDPSHDPADLGDVQISDRGRERRTCHAVRLARGLVVANLHASSLPGAPEIVDAEIRRALDFVEQLARGEPAVIAGDLNREEVRLPGFSAPGPGIDQVLVRGADATEPFAWPVERRTVDGIVLSDHAPVEAAVG
jgi:endonuclease/exonuclease/phosphatase family metal-dependent hydrolase